MEFTQHLPAKHPAEKQSGFSIIELLIALIIIGILTSIAVLNVADRADEARLRKAQADMGSIRKALEHSAIDTGYYYRLYVLNDTSGGDGIGGIVDGILDEEVNPNVGNPGLIFISTTEGTFLTVGQSAAAFDRLRSNETSFGWKGAYVNWSENWLIGANDTGIPLDPWGNPYLLFTQAGYVEEPDGVLRTEASPVNINSIVGSPRFTPLSFDRMTLVSFGPDGLPGNANAAITDVGQGDDLKTQW